MWFFGGVDHDFRVKFRFVLWSSLEGAQAKLVFALEPRNALAALSYALAASSAVSKVPSHTRVFFHGSRISAANRPQSRFLTPLKCTPWPACLLFVIPFSSLEAILVIPPPALVIAKLHNNLPNRASKPPRSLGNWMLSLSTTKQ